MAQTFKLVAVGSVVPASGENLGDALARFGDAETDRFRANPDARIMHWGNGVAQIYYLAAEAFEQGASASIGHSRSDRYTERARGLRATAESISAEAQAQRATAEGERLRAAFADGYEGGDVSRYSFDARAAFLVGRYFAAEKLPPIQDSVRVYPGDAESSNYVEVGLYRYAVRYPGGKVADATVEPID